MFKYVPSLALALLAFSSTQALDVTVDPAIRHQPIAGFGAGTVYYQNWLTAHPAREAIYDTLFTGLGVSLLRVGNWNQDETSSLSLDSTIVAEGRKRLGDRMQILMSSWSAPASLKVNGKVEASSSTYEQNTLKQVNGKYVYDLFASWWRRSLERYRSVGIDPSYITIQNEPDMNTDYASMILLPSAPYTVYPNGSPLSVTTATYPAALKAVYDTLSRLDKRPAILGPEVLGIGYNNFTNYNSKTDTSLLDGYAFHLYHGNGAPSSDTYLYPDGFNTLLSETLAPIFSTKPTIMTEFCPMRDPKPTDMIAAAQIMQNLLTKGLVNGFISWELMWKENGQAVALENPWQKDSWKSPQGYFVNPEYHALRHFSRFVSPGWDRVSAISPDTSLRVIAFASPDNDSLTLVAIHLAASPISVSLPPPSSMHVDQVWQSQASVVTATGRLDDALLSKKLVAQPTQSEWILPANSITTIVWTSSSLASIPVMVSKSRPAASFRVYDSLGKLVGTFSNQPMRLPPGIWLVESLDAQGKRITTRQVRFPN